MASLESAELVEEEADVREAQGQVGPFGVRVPGSEPTPDREGLLARLGRGLEPPPPWRARPRLWRLLASPGRKCVGLVFGQAAVDVGGLGARPDGFL